MVPRRQVRVPPGPRAVAQRPGAISVFAELRSVDRRGGVTRASTVWARPRGAPPPAPRGLPRLTPASLTIGWGPSAPP